MNYRHAFHAGNFADLLKHAALTLCLDALAARSGAMTLVDTHAGAGVYDLGGEEARKSGEAVAGVNRLAADPAAPEAFDMLLAAVARINPGADMPRFYPGSPMLISSALRAGDRFIACELRPQEQASLAALLSSVEGASALHADGFAAAVDSTAPGKSTFVIIDPPFERGDDYERVVQACAGVLKKDARAVILVWLPLKDLETFDRFLRGLEEIEPQNALIVECRLRPLDNPMAMNGCALVLINPPQGVAAPIEAANDWIVRQCGGAGGEGRVWTL
jgi:23S rRNA (adenine2030-N6)-methyltransferase